MVCVVLCCCLCGLVWFGLVLCWRGLVLVLVRFGVAGWLARLHVLALESNCRQMNYMYTHSLGTATPSIHYTKHSSSNRGGVRSGPHPIQVRVCGSRLDPRRCRP